MTADDGGAIGAVAELDSDADAMASPTSASPVQVLDQRLRVTTARTWMVFLGVILLLAAGLVWSVLGKAPVEVHGQSITLPPDGLYDVGVGVEGFVDELLVSPGDLVTVDQVLARIVQGNGQVTEVKSNAVGTVVTLLVKRGSYTRAGDAVATIEPKGSELIGVLYVPAQAGKVIKTGMRAYLSPSTAPAAQYGSMVGTVSYVSQLPATSERIRLNLSDNQDLIDFLSGSGPVLELAIDLEPDPSTASGYEWTSGSGPPFAISSATLGTGSVVVSERSPASQLFG